MRDYYHEQTYPHFKKEETEAERLDLPKVTRLVAKVELESRFVYFKALVVSLLPPLPPIFNSRAQTLFAILSINLKPKSLPKGIILFNMQMISSKLSS